MKAKIETYTRNDGKVRYRVVTDTGIVVGCNFWTRKSAARFVNEVEATTR